MWNGGNGEELWNWLGIGELYIVYKDGGSNRIWGRLSDLGLGSQGWGYDRCGNGMMQVGLMVIALLG